MKNKIRIWTILQPAKLEKKRTLSKIVTIFSYSMNLFPYLDRIQLHPTEKQALMRTSFHFHQCEMAEKKTLLPNFLDSVGYFEFELLYFVCKTVNAYLLFSTLKKRTLL